MKAEIKKLENEVASANAALISFADRRFQDNNPETIAVFDFTPDTSKDLTNTDQAGVEVKELEDKLQHALTIIGGIEFREPHGGTYVKSHFEHFFKPNSTY